MVNLDWEKQDWGYHTKNRLTDIGETKNLAGKYPKKVKALKAKLDEIKVGNQFKKCCIHHFCFPIIHQKS